MGAFGRLVQGRAPWALGFAIAAAAAWSQQPAPEKAQSAAPTASQGQPDRRADDAWLAKAAKRYFSTKAEGLKGFDCDIRPDWPTIFASVNKGAPLAADDPRLVALKPVRMAVHARMAGGSTVEWVLTETSDKPLDPDAKAAIDQIHQGMEQIVQGFLQFWTPFVDGSVVPANSEGIRVTHSPTEYTLRLNQGGTNVTEVFSTDMVLEHFDLVMSGTTVKFTPSYQPTEKGLLVNRFDALIQPAQSSEPAQEMHVQVGYADVEGIPIPSHLKVEVVGTGTFNMALEGCKAIRATK